MDIASLEAEADQLVLAQFTEDTALALGAALVGMARADKHPVVIDIRTADRTLFHAAMPGSRPLNDLWARRKGNVALMFHEASMLVTLRFRAKGQTLDRDGLAGADYALSGGAVPVRVAGAGMVAVATVSGLPEEVDHALVVKALRDLI